MTSAPMALALAWASASLVERGTPWAASRIRPLRTKSSAWAVRASRSRNDSSVRGDQLLLRRRTRPGLRRG